MLFYLLLGRSAQREVISIDIALRCQYISARKEVMLWQL